jgi:quinol monooxygenase YgiN
MPTIIATVTVQEGKMDDALEAIRTIVPGVRENEPGALAYVAHTVTGEGNENLIVFYEKYEDAAAMKTHMDNLMETLGPLLPFIDPNADMKICEEII